MGPGISILPYIPVPIGGVGSDTLVRDMIDLDCWILSTEAGHNSCLPDSREMFWRLVLDLARGGRRVYTSSAPLSLPAGTRNPRIRNFMSGAFDRPIPAAIPPFTENEEKTVIRTVFNELNEKFCVGLDNPPSFSRSIAAPPTVHSNGRMVFVGRSNLGKIAKAAAEKGSLVVDLTVSGWSPKPGNIKKVAEVLKNLNLQPCDTIVIDAMANSAYFGTDENGLPMPPAKSSEDGQYHMLGDLQLAPTAVFKTNLRQIDSLLERGGGRWSSSLCLCPARYVRNSCCGDSEHVTNQGEEDFYEEFLGAEKRLLAELERSDKGETGEQVTKRQRLESVVPAPRCR
jgi:hypothetical protein